MIAAAQSFRTVSVDEGPASKFYFTIILLAILAYAIWQRFSLPLDPCADPDTWGYLSPALRKLTGQPFGHTYSRNFLYPGFLYVILRVFGDFRAITVTQHLLGLTAGGILLLTWSRARRFVAKPRIGRAGHCALGLFGVALFLCASETIRLERQLRPEGIVAFLISLSLYFAVRFISCVFLERRPAVAIAYGVALGFVAIALGSVKPSFWFVVGVDLLLITLFLFRPEPPRYKLALISGVVLSGVLLLLPEQFLSRTDEESQTFLPTTLFVVHANLIRDQMAQDITDDIPLPYTADRLRRVHNALSAEIAKSHEARPDHYSSLGFDPDYLMYNKSSVAAQLRQEFANDVSAVCTFCLFYYARIWIHRPVAVVAKIGHQMAIFCRPRGLAYNPGKRLRLSDEYAQTIGALNIEPYPKLWRSYPPAVLFMRRSELLAQTAPVVTQPFLIRAMLYIVAPAYLPLILLAGTVSFVALRHNGQFGDLRLLAFLVLVVLSLSFASLLEVAIIHSLEIGRYRSVQFLLTLFSVLLSTWLLLESALRKRSGYTPLTS